MATSPNLLVSQKMFFDSIFKISHRFSVSQVFEDFLTMSIAACSRNPTSGLSYYEEEYLQTIARYKTLEVRHEFPKAFSYLVVAMEERVSGDSGNDVLGDYFEQNISNGRNGQFFTPHHICHFMATCTKEETDKKEENEPLRILDPSCGSGRMLLASHRVHGAQHRYFGIDIDQTCVKMTALNLFLNGVWNSEVMCGNALLPDNFIISYFISFMPLGIFKITDKEKSLLFKMHQQSFVKEKASDKIVLNSTPFSERVKNEGTQLGLF